MKSISRPPGRALPSYLKNKLANPPRAGTGLHQWLFGMALMLHGHLPAAEIVALLAAAVKNCGRDVPPREIEDAVANSKALASRPWQPSASRVSPPTSSPKWPRIDSGLRAKIVESSLGVEALRQASPLSIDDCEHDAHYFLSHLFPAGSLVCVGLSNDLFATHLLDDVLGVDLVKTCLIVPSPMTARVGVTKRGKRSQHTLSNTGPRRYLVTEFDSGSADEQAPLIMHLSGFAPLVMVVSSGGKSLHAWWRCAGVDEQAQLNFFRYAVSLGADPATWCRSQFVRLPQGWRADKGTRQQVLYFNPAALPVDGEGA